MPVDMDGDYVLVTVHRAENTDDPDRISGILGALNAIARKTNVVFPMHPRTKAAIDKLNLKIEFEPWSPVGYLEMLSLIKGSRFVITDSGGLQKEAAFFNKYCLTLRDETEWVELVEAKVNFLVGADQETIMNSFEKLNVGLDKFPDSVAELYGDGNASEVIAKELLDDQRC
jgi:UDP-GlcNAc3NAcA epimerase